MNNVNWGLNIEGAYLKFSLKGEIVIREGIAMGRWVVSKACMESLASGNLNNIFQRIETL